MLELQRNIHYSQFPGDFCLMAEADEHPTVAPQNVNVMLELCSASVRIQRKASQLEEEN